MYICIFVYLLLGTCILCRRKKCSRRGLVLLRTLRALGSTSNGWRPRRQSQNSASPNSAGQSPNSNPASQSPNSAQNNPPPSQTAMKSSASSCRGRRCGRDTTMTMPRCHVQLVGRDVARGHHHPHGHHDPASTPRARANFGARRRGPSRRRVWAGLQSCRGAD